MILGNKRCAPHVTQLAENQAREEVGAAVVLRPGETLDAEALRAHCTRLIGRHKAPRYVWVLDTLLPRNAIGKFLKRELRETLAVANAG